MTCPFAHCVWACGGVCVMPCMKRRECEAVMCRREQVRAADRRIHERIRNRRMQAAFCPEAGC